MAENIKQKSATPAKEVLLFTGTECVLCLSSELNIIKVPALQELIKL